MRSHTIKGFYGSNLTPSDVFILTTPNGTWYVVDGGTVVNFTTMPVQNGVNVEELSDIDCFTWSGPIESEEELYEAVNS